MKPCKPSDGKKHVLVHTMGGGGGDGGGGDGGGGEGGGRDGGYLKRLPQSVQSVPMAH